MHIVVIERSGTIMRHRCAMALSCLISLSDAADSRISDHFRELKSSKAHERDTTLLPEVAAVPILRLHDSLNVGANYLKMMLHESAARKETPDEYFPYVLCGPQGAAEVSRELLRKASGNSRASIAYTSRVDDVACWHADIRVADATAFSGEPCFFHITPLPAVSKLAPTLVLHSDGAPLRVNPLVFDPNEPRLRIILRPSIANNTKLRAAALRAWGLASFGLEGDHAEAFFPYRKSAEGGSTAWSSARDRAALADCPRRIGLRGDGDDGAADASGVRLAFSALMGQMFEPPRRGAAGKAAGSRAVDPGAGPTADDHSCALLALAFLAVQPEVQVIEVHEPATLLAYAPLPSRPRTRFPTGPSSAREDVSRVTKNIISPRTLVAAEVVDRLMGSSTLQDSEKEELLGHLAEHALTPPVAMPADYSSAAALQSGDVGDFPLWNIGINGADELVHVTDTGTDDASCFLRDFGPASSLDGQFSPSMQVNRSVWDSPITDFRFRKVVQYVAHNKSRPFDFFLDSKGGHGSHVAATVVGSKLNSTESIYYGEDAVNCTWLRKYIRRDLDLCSILYCPTCTYPNLCDATCGFHPPEMDYPGMAPGAKILVHDFGDEDQALKVPSNYATRIFIPGYDAGARIFTNSWGGASYYPYGSSQQGLDEWIYDTKSVLVLFAAGNDGGEASASEYAYYNNITFEEKLVALSSQDKSIGPSAQCKNVVAVGAAETAAAPTTVATFSSRGPANDGRIKPDVIGPGDPVLAESASGLAGLATCDVVSMSGTSMATPAVAGIAALLRQYLAAEKHVVYSPNGFSASSYNATAPSGALVKAMLVGGTIPLTSGYNSSGDAVTLATFYGATTAVADTAPYPLGTVGLDFHQGFGHVRTSALFPLDGSFDTLLFEQSLSAYSQWTTFFPLVPSTAVGITLVWSDPPAPLYCGESYFVRKSTEAISTPCLVHDLDLIVSYNGKRYFANFGAASEGAFAQAEDTLNNVEKVVIPVDDLTAGAVVNVQVRTNGLAFAPTQDFAVVVTGKLSASCPAGHYGTVGSCTSCLIGTYSTAGAKACNSCPPGNYQATAGTASCSACAAGLYSTAVGAVHRSTCEECAVDTYSSSPGASACAKCSSGLASGLAATVCGEGPRPSPAPTVNVFTYRISTSAYFTGSFSSAADFTSAMQQAFILAVVQTLEAQNSLGYSVPSPSSVTITSIELRSRRMRRMLASTSLAVNYNIDVVSTSPSSATVLTSVQSDLFTAVSSGSLQTSITSIGGSLFASVFLDPTTTSTAVSAASVVTLSAHPTQRPTRHPLPEPTKMPSRKTQPAPAPGMSSSEIAAAVSIPIIIIAIGAGLFAYFRYFRSKPDAGGDDSAWQKAFQSRNKQEASKGSFKVEMGDVYGDSAPDATGELNRMSKVDARKVARQNQDL